MYLPFTAPLIVDKNWSDEEIRLECEMELKRSRATEDFLDGLIDVEVFEDILNENHVDPIQAYEDWTNGLTYF